ncbi:hypothetical protein K458DRAFT_439230 [Lentithecium fluviatile CBS 122367]|uniref:Isopenicillin N synthase-like Fe(2+) 2OG dioxygenase domain-containing protein n=1 Tax=Lentithecium fluviatile CBS 122367 TaxID=1168545 RepID=A0A6G1JI88_9PLEO|nr:hypothetical protein K458DRAFT_439230 [Lentithecium fluviatile CBS 122367]
MASKKHFESIPAFPNDVPTAPTYATRLAGLNSDDQSAAKSLLGACQELRFFLLDLRDDTLGEAIIQAVDILLEAGKDIMNLSYEVIDKFKHRGIIKVETNEPDRFEWFNLGPDVLAHLTLFGSFVQHGQRIVSTINTTLAKQLSLAADTFASLQSTSKPSESKDLRTSMIHHTDFVTITLLANVLGGLQVLTPGKAMNDKDTWLYVRPEPGCLIVNLGDAMLHFAPGEQCFVDRYSLALLRLVGEGEGRDSEVGDLTTWEWEMKQIMTYKRDEVNVESKGGRTAAAARTSHCICMLLTKRTHGKPNCLGSLY